MQVKHKLPKGVDIVNKVKWHRPCLVTHTWPVD